MASDGVFRKGGEGLLVYTYGKLEKIDNIPIKITIPVKQSDNGERPIEFSGNITHILNIEQLKNKQIEIATYYISDLDYEQTTKYIPTISEANDNSLTGVKVVCLLSKNSNNEYIYDGLVTLDTAHINKTYNAVKLTDSWNKDNLTKVEVNEKTSLGIILTKSSVITYIVLPKQSIPKPEIIGIGALDSSNVLEILKLWDSEGDEYIMNEQNVYQINPLTLYLPNVKEGTIVYVEYKTMPPQLVFNGGNSSTFPLPPELYKLLYALVALKVVRSIDDFKSMEGAILNNYALELQQAMNSNWALSNEMESTLQFKKGFY